MSPHSSLHGRYRSRSQARMLALQALCVYEAVGDAFAADLNDFLRDGLVLEDLEIEQPPPAELLAFARTLVDGAWARRPGYDDLLSRTVTHWRIGRMPPVDRNVLRLGLFELLDQREAAPAIIINEAVELARRFGDKDSPAFVNGVLDAIRRACEPGAPQAGTPATGEAGPAPAADTEAPRPAPAE